MKRVLITGKNSYVGNSFADWVKDDPDFKVDKISLRDDSWKELDFTVYDVVLHVAGIAHQKETKKNKESYYRVNTDLTFNVAKKANEEGINHFIFLSSMSVYGLETGVIDEKTSLKPKTNYGKSKLAAEVFIKSLETDSFIISILRPPMIYGKGCKGNYQRLSKLASITPVFPNVCNERSMVYIEHLSHYIKLVIEKEEKGEFHPQNSEFINTTDLVKVICQLNGKKIKITRMFNIIISLFSGKINIFDKVFGDFKYVRSNQEEIPFSDYNLYNFKTTIKNTELK